MFGVILLKISKVNRILPRKISPDSSVERNFAIFSVLLKSFPALVSKTFHTKSLFSQSIATWYYGVVFAISDLVFDVHMCKVQVPQKFELRIIVEIFFEIFLNFCWWFARLHCRLTDAT